jgi:hypothetical protein
MVSTINEDWQKTETKEASEEHGGHKYSEAPSGVR